MRIGVVAPSSPVGQIELNNGVALLRAKGFDVDVHPFCAHQHFIVAGTDADRARAFYDFATDNRIDAIWAAGGGYGATRILPLLEQLADESGTPPGKLLVGYSDVTALHDFVRSRWNWATLHFPMPSAGDFTKLDARYLDAAVAYVNRRRPPDPWAGVLLRYLVNEPRLPVHGVLVGGNLSLWAATTGTPYAPIAVPGRIVFLEDVDEAPHRVDRMITQLLQAGTFFGVTAIVLGDFTRCEDEPSNVLESPTPPGEQPKKRPLRQKFTPDECLAATFVPLGEQLGIPVAAGLPVGHGPNFAPLPLGAEYTLTPERSLHLNTWNWIRA